MIKMNNDLENIKKEQEYLEELRILAEYDGEDKVISSKEKDEELEADFLSPSFRVPTRIPTLDRLTDGGFREGELITITGITKSGKSALARTLCSNFVEKEINSVYFSYEETARELLERFRKPYPIFYLPRLLRSCNTDWIHAKIGEAVAKYGIKAAFIDNLDFLLDRKLYERHGNVSDMIKFVVLDLKNTARYYRVAIFLTAHTTQAGMRQGIDIGDIKGSSSISQISDFVLCVKRIKDKETGLAGRYSRVQILANRRTGLNGEAKMLFNDQYLEELAEENYENTK